MCTMFVQMRKTIVTEGSADQGAKRFNREGLVEKQEGFVDLTVMVKKVQSGEEEVIVMIRWESEEYWQRWEKSDAYLANLKVLRAKPMPEYIVSAETGFYEVKVDRKTAK